MRIRERESAHVIQSKKWRYVLLACRANKGVKMWITNFCACSNLAKDGDDIPNEYMRFFFSLT